MQDNKKFPSNPFPANSQIRAQQVICLDESGNNLGIKSIHEALSLAQQSGTDLVQIALSKKDQVPTCKITDYGRFKFEQQKRQKEQNKKQREARIEEKEIQFRYTTELNDLKVKAKKAQEFIDDGHRVKVIVKFHGREMSHPEVGKQTLQEFLDCLHDIDVSKPAFTGKDLITYVTQKK